MYRLTGQFRDQTNEVSYRQSIAARVRTDSRFALILVSFIFGMFGITDYFLLGVSREFYLLISMRLTVMSACIAFAFVIGRWGSYSERAWLHLLPVLIFATGVIAIVPLRPDSLLTQITAVVVAIMGFYLLIPNLLSVAAIASLYLSVGFLAAALFYADLSAQGALRLGLLLIMTNLVGFAALRRLEILQRKQFALLQEEREQNRHLLNEIAHRQSLEAQLRLVAEHDALTGLDSRSHFMKRAEALLAHAKLASAPFSLFMIDVDHFKQINDTWGHSRGDQVLVKIADVCADSLRPSDVIGRFGGEEFIVALPNTDAFQAKMVAERLKKRVAALQLTEIANDLQLSVTIGVATASEHTIDLDALIVRADKMLYIGKRNGRNRVVVCSDSSPDSERQQG